MLGGTLGAFAIMDWRLKGPPKLPASAAEQLRAQDTELAGEFQGATI